MNSNVQGDAGNNYDYFSGVNKWKLDDAAHTYSFDYNSVKGGSLADLLLIPDDVLVATAGFRCSFSLPDFYLLVAGVLRRYNRYVYGG